MEVALGDDEATRLFDTAGGADDLHREGTVELAGLAGGATRHAELVLITGEDLALGLRAGGPEDADTLEIALGAHDGHRLLAGELPGLHEVLGLGQAVALAEEGLEICL